MRKPIFNIKPDQDARSKVISEVNAVLKKRKARTDQQPQEDKTSLPIVAKTTK